MDVTLSPEFERLVNEKLIAGEYRSADDVINAAMHLFKEREEDRAVVRGVNEGEPLPVDDRMETRIEMLLQEAEESGDPVEMTPEDWKDIERDAMAILKSRRSA